jgi:hypothetical protein
MFESMIVSEAQRLQSEGKRGLQILPGVQEMLSVVSLEGTRRIRATAELDSYEHRLNKCGPLSPLRRRSTPPRLCQPQASSLLLNT